MKIEIQIPDELIIEKNHYLINGKKYYRVTRIKSVINNQGLNNWIASIGQKKAFEIMKKSAAFGSKNHKLFALILTKKEVNAENYDEDTKCNLNLLKEFITEHKIRPILVEQTLWSEYGYAGTTDFVGYVDDELMLLDWKTGNGIYPDYWLQLSAYVWALNELTGIKIDKVGIVRFKNNKTEYKTKKYGEVMKDFELFKCCLYLYLNYPKSKEI